MLGEMQLGVHYLIRAFLSMAIAHIGDVYGWLECERENRFFGSKRSPTLTARL